MLKKTITALISLSVSATSFASGFYIGAGVGPQQSYFDQKARIVRPGSFNVIDKEQFGGVGAFGSLFGGYGFVYECYYLAGEINADISNGGFRSSNSEFIHRNFSTTHYKIRNNFGVSLLPGYEVSPTALIYGRLAYENGLFKVETSDISLKNTSRRVGGFRYGLGMQQDIGCHLAVRIEYSHIDYQNTRMSTFDSGSSVSKKTRISPEINEVEFGLLYHFC